jgi:hypothetical protein
LLLVRQRSFTFAAYQQRLLQVEARYTNEGANCIRYVSWYKYQKVMDKKSLIGTIVIVILFIGAVIWSNSIQDDLKKNGILVPAKILRVNYGGKVSGGFECLINYNGEQKERPSISSLKSGRYNFVGKTFPGMYSPKTNTLEILIAPVDFKKFDIPFPDSLKWVLEYITEK